MHLKWKTEKCSRNSTGEYYRDNSTLYSTTAMAIKKEESQSSVNLLNNDINSPTKITLKNSSALKNDVKLTQYNVFNSFHHQSQQQQDVQHQLQQKTLEPSSSSVHNQQECQSSSSAETIIDTATNLNNSADDTPIIMNNNLKQQKGVRNALLSDLNVSDFSPYTNIMSQQDNAAAGKYSSINLLNYNKNKI